MHWIKPEKYQHEFILISQKPAKVKINRTSVRFPYTADDDMDCPAKTRGCKHKEGDDADFLPETQGLVVDQDIIGEKHGPAQADSGHAGTEGEKRGKIQGIPGMNRGGEQKIPQTDQVETLQKLFKGQGTRFAFRVECAPYDPDDKQAAKENADRER